MAEVLELTTLVLIAGVAAVIGVVMVADVLTW